MVLGPVQRLSHYTGNRSSGSASRRSHCSRRELGRPRAELSFSLSELVQPVATERLYRLPAYAPIGLKSVEVSEKFENLVRTPPWTEVRGQDAYCVGVFDMLILVL